MSNQFTNPWTNNENELLREFVKQGLSNQEISTRLNRSIKSVSMQKWRLNLKNNREYNKYKNKEWLTEMYVNKEYSTTDIANITGVHNATIAKWLKKFGIEARGFYEKTERHKDKLSERLKGRTGDKSPGWRGGTLTTDEGYIYRKAPNHPYANANGYYPEHRLIMEESLGRYLKPTEVVHHINRERDDNRIENLFLFKSGSDHSRFHAMERKYGNGVELSYEFK